MISGAICTTQALNQTSRKMVGILNITSDLNETSVTIEKLTKKTKQSCNIWVRNCCAWKGLSSVFTRKLFHCPRPSISPFCNIRP